MYAIIAACGKQYKVAPGAKVVLDHLDAEEGATVTFDQVLLINGETIQVGAPTIAGAKVEGKVVSHFLGEKVHTFKYRRRTRNRRSVGSRHHHTTVEITGISA